MKRKCTRQELISIPYMNTLLWKAMYSRNMSHNKFRKYGKWYWQESRHQRNLSLWTQSRRKYFPEKLIKKDEHFRKTISPFSIIRIQEMATISFFERVIKVSLTAMMYVAFLTFIWLGLSHDDVIQWKHFPRYWPSVRGIHRSTVNSPYKGQWRGALMFSLICALNKRFKQTIVTLVIWNAIALIMT